MHIVLYRKVNDFYFSYCDHTLSADLDAIVTQLLRDVVRFQDNAHAKDPVKAKARRRYVIGFREVKKFLVVKKVSRSQYQDYSPLSIFM